MSQFTNEVNIASQPIDVTGPLTDAELRATPVPISGTVTATPSGTQDVNVTNASVAVTGPLTDTELRATPVPISGSVSTTPVVATSSTITQVISTGSNQTLLAANVNRRQALFFFESGTWYLKLGATASASSLTYKIAANNTLIEAPALYTGIIDVFCTSSGKLVDVTELTA